MTGQLVAVVGPSGVGKDSVMAGIVAADPRYGLVRRVITRDAAAGGEAFDSATPQDFARMVAEGAFCLHWQAHGLRYGIPAALRAEVAAGSWRLVNLSRGILPEAAALFPGLVVLNLTASPEILAARLSGRGRESGTDIAQRLTRPAAPLPEDVRRLDLCNDGDLGDTVTLALRQLQPERA